MYKSKDRKTMALFPELFPFGGKLDERNRWLRIAELIPWEELEEGYRKHFSDVGRPAKDAQLVVGPLLVKHMTGLSDEGLVNNKTFFFSCAGRASLLISIHPSSHRKKV